MAKLIFLGTSNAISSEDHENTHLILVGEKRTVLIDCPNSPFLRFKKAGVDFNRLSDLIVTHFHPDHVSGVPQLLMNMWLMGRKRPLKVYGFEHAIERIEKLMDLYNWSNWPDFFPVEILRLPEQALVTVLDCEEFRIQASPVQHFIPTMGLRIEFSSSKKIVAYSCDTEPCAQVTELAEGADVLVHEFVWRIARAFIRNASRRSGAPSRGGIVVSDPLSDRAIRLRQPGRRSPAAV